MSLTLHFHPLASYCWKALIALYENGTPFVPNLVDLGNETERAALLKLWPIGKFPVLRDEARDQTVPESSVIIEYLDRHYPGATHSSPPIRTWRGKRGCATASTISICICRCRRSSETGCALRGRRDPHGVEEARAQLRTSYRVIEAQMAGHNWAMGEAFSLADCAAFPALFYGNMVEPFGDANNNVTAYLERLKTRPSIARVLAEAEPYFNMVPK